QAQMIANTLDARYRGVELTFVRVAYTRERRNTGRPSFRKALHLAAAVVRVAVARVRTRATVLYYAPAGAQPVPVARDIVFLLCIRWLFPMTVLHFHAAGVSELYDRLPRAVR